jgi:hypothetical protein
VGGHVEEIGESTGISDTGDSRRQRNCATGIVESQNPKEDRKHPGRGHVAAGRLLRYFRVSGVPEVSGELLHGIHEILKREVPKTFRRVLSREHFGIPDIGISGVLRMRDPGS